MINPNAWRKASKQPINAEKSSLTVKISFENKLRFSDFYGNDDVMIRTNDALTQQVHQGLNDDLALHPAVLPPF